MTWLDSVRTAWDALMANKLRSSLTMLGMVIGVAAVVAIISIGRGARESVSRQLTTLGTDMFVLYVDFRPPPEEEGRGTMRIFRMQDQGFTMEDIDKVKLHIRDAQYVVTRLNFGTEISLGGEPRYLEVQAVFPEYAEMMNLPFKAGRFFSQEEYDEAARVAVIHSRTLEEIMPDESEPVGKTISVQNYPYTIIGIIDEDAGAASGMFGSSSGVLVPLSTLQKHIGWMDRNFHELLVKVRPDTDLDQTAELTKEFLETIHPGMFIGYFSPRSIQNTAGNVTDTVARFAAAIAAISLLVGGIGIMNIMLVSVAERTREIGLRKALGATDEQILVQFLVEAGVTGVAGGGLGMMAALIPNHIASKWLQIEVGISPDTVALALGFAGAIGLIFGVYPALQAARLDPIEALRQE